MKRYQRGVSIVGLLWQFFFVVCFIFITAKLGPPYVENYFASQAMNKLAAHPQVMQMERPQLVSALHQYLTQDKYFVYEGGILHDVDVNQAFTVQTRGNRRLVRLEYEVSVPIVKNLSAVIAFSPQAIAVRH